MKKSCFCSVLIFALILMGGLIVLLNLATEENVPSGSPVTAQLQQNESGNFVLFVSSQSFAIDPVDIKVYIDGKVAVNQDFYVENQHNWQGFQFSLSGGTRILQVESTKGDAILEKEFKIVDKHYAVVDYWYYPEVTGGAGPTPKQFSFHIQDEPIGFD